VRVVCVVIEFGIQDDHIEGNEWLNYGKSVLRVCCHEIISCFVKL
jgi:hypothetical protein